VAYGELQSLKAEWASTNKEDQQGVIRKLELQEWFDSRLTAMEDKLFERMRKQKL
jgi:hypothetical protein